ncbi:probable ascorbate-specific transmembrane electron transporter 1 [Phragmites australis]|uniref:probable ascorbate-specific transmembrane electron transporter 1 n=1 Tax=Phragmites australis TaxID=29695 RepID=UPI002D76CCBB|nr:probable ascorbate-specific transmembrane electron transporter 1 [Phragmites australis]
MPSRTQRQPAVVVVAVVPERRRTSGGGGRGRQRAIMPVKSSASFRLTAVPMVATAQLLAAAVLTLTLVWVLHFRGGVSWERTSSPLFVYTAHPLFMVIGLVICTGEAVMAYRIILGPRAAKKAVHLMLHLVALAFAAVGLYAAFKYHRDAGLPDVHSLHSWLGIATIALYALQWLVAFVYFVFPGAVMTMRADYAPWHIFFGIVIFLMAICTAETGLAKFVFPGDDYPSEAFVVNFTGLAIQVFGVVVVLAVVLPSRY